jgi:serine/threonine-protein kinase ULK/ATG1
MVKIVDNYVLERVIGKGQYGEVFKGYKKDTNEDVAIKAVNRKNLKGKFYELLENEIKVLRSCNNVNIIKLYDIKKTSNNIYLMLEYCNEGDLMQYLKKRGKLTEEETIEFFIQILNAFKTLVKNKIMHRDFKLANILKHNGIIKIADFGFAKILGEDAFTTTMLGSPLNMAPEILGGKDYNSKADIWSIGTCVYELLFGKPPYTAKNIVELLQKIQKTPFSLPPNTKISPVLEDVLKKMLVFNPDERIEWDDLFNHKITKLMEEKIMLDLEETIKNNDINNISKFYIKNNKVIDHVVEIEKRRDINDFALEAVKNSTKGERNSNFKGNYVNRNFQRDQEENEVDFKQAYAENNGQVTEDETERERMIRIFKHNSSRILHERNKYVFLASVAEDAISHAFKFSDMIGYILIKKLFRMLCEIKYSLENQKNTFGLEYWSEYLQTPDYRKISNYINKEFELFKNYYENLNQTIIKKFHSQNSKNSVLEKLIKAGTEEEINSILKKIFKDYVEVIFGPENIQKVVSRKDIWVHVNQLLDCLNAEKVFYFSKDLSKQFNFKLFYEEVKLMEISVLIDLVRNKLKFENIAIPL